MSEGPIENRWDDQLFDREIRLIGRIVVQWGALEHEIFTQTLLTFDAPQGERIDLPKAMNNLQVTEMLALWKQRVIDQAVGEKAKVLQLQHDEILRLKDFRDAIVHGMWNWSATDLTAIRTVRVRKKEVLTTRFTADDLAYFYGRLANINFKVRFPGGLEDLARSQESGYVSRRWLSMMNGNAVDGGGRSRSPASASDEEQVRDRDV